MTKAELIEKVAEAADCSKADAERTLSAFFELVVASTTRGDKVAWPGFGAFSTTNRGSHRSQPTNGCDSCGSCIHCDEVLSELNAQS